MSNEILKEKNKKRKLYDLSSNLTAIDFLERNCDKINCKMIDFTYIPKDLQKEILKEFKKTE
jgi:hypothetical protein